VTTVEAWELSAREGIRATIARCSHSGDRYDIDALAACFTPDGVLALSGGPIGVRAAAGRQEIIAMLRRRQPDPPSHGFVRHNVASIHIEAIAQDRATVVSYFVVFTANGPDHWGRYFDVFLRAGEEWLIAERRIEIEGTASDSSLEHRWTLSGEVA
jgi:hypothetical protein